MCAKIHGGPYATTKKISFGFIDCDSRINIICITMAVFESQIYNDSPTFIKIWQSNDLITLVIAIPLLIFFLFLSYFFFKIAINYNTYYLLKYNDRGFSYLHQPNIKGTTRSMTIQTFEKYYYKPKYYNFPFLYVKAFQLAKNKIEIVYENNRIEKFPVELSQEKTKKGIVLLNSWLDAYNKKNIK